MILWAKRIFEQQFGYKYGTPKQTVLNFLGEKDVLFDIDWKGYQQLKQSNVDVVIYSLPSKKELVTD